MTEPPPPPARATTSRGQRAYVRGVFRFLWWLWLFGMAVTAAWFVRGLAGLMGLTGRPANLQDLFQPLQFAAVLVVLWVGVWLARLGVKALYPGVFTPPGDRRG